MFLLYTFVSFFLHQNLLVYLKIPLLPTFVLRLYPGDVLGNLLAALDLPEDNLRLHPGAVL